MIDNDSNDPLYISVQLFSLLLIFISYQFMLMKFCCCSPGLTLQVVAKSSPDHSAGWVVTVTKESRSLAFCLPMQESQPLSFGQKCYHIATGFFPVLQLHLITPTFSMPLILLLSMVLIKFSEQ